MTAPSRSSRLALLAVGLYPLAFRRRYGQEMRALVEETPARATTVLDLLRGALVAHVRPPAGTAGLVGAADRVRASASGVLACWVMFAASGFAFAVTTEDAPFTNVDSAHLLLGDARVAVFVAGLIGSAAVVLGALPLILAALGEARRRRPMRLLVILPVLAVLLFLGLTQVLALAGKSSNGHGPTTVGGIAFIAWGLAGLACGAVCVIASRKALFAVQTSPARLMAAFASGTLVTAVMAAITVATVLYAIALPVDASRTAASPNGPLQAVSVSVSLVLIAVVMAIATALAVATTRRGWRAAGELNAGPASANL